jgi:ELWxxDGT repeat protein
VNPGSADSNPRNIVGLNSVALFTANDGTHGRELWTTDGTTSGTAMVADINPGSASSAPVGSLGPGNNSAINFNGTVYFEATDGTHGQELWQSDGTAAGTIMVADINPSSASSNPSGMTAYNGRMYFMASDGVDSGNFFVLTPTTAPTQS